MAPLDARRRAALHLLELGARRRELRLQLAHRLRAAGAGGAHPREVVRRLLERGALVLQRCEPLRAPLRLGVAPPPLVRGDGGAQLLRQPIRHRVALSVEAGERGPRVERGEQRGARGVGKRVPRERE